MRRLILSLSILIASFVSAPAWAKSDPIYTSWRNNKAVEGYDVVSFYSGKPILGSDELTERYMGVIWHFSTQANLDLFKTNPEIFAPQYGGYCAWAVSMNKLAKGSAKHWHVEDGKLYLNFNKKIKNRWDKDRPDFIEQADSYWPEILED